MPISSICIWLEASIIVGFFIAIDSQSEKDSIVKDTSHLLMTEAEESRSSLPAKQEIFLYISKLGIIFI